MALSSTNEKSTRVELLQQTHISILPNEVLMLILQYLRDNVRDVLSWCSVCHSWRYVGAGVLADVAAFVIRSDAETKAKAIVNSDILYKHLLVQKCDIRLTDTFIELWRNIGEGLESLTLDACNVLEEDFAPLLSHCTKLKTLRFTNLENILMSCRPLSNANEYSILSTSLQHMQRLDIVCKRNVSDWFLNSLKNVLPPLASLSIATTNISYQDVIHKRFYPVINGTTPGPSLFVATFKAVLAMVTPTLRHLDVSSTSIDTPAIKRLLNVRHLELQSLCLAECHQVTNAAVVALCRGGSAVQQLSRLDLSGCKRITCDAMTAVAGSLPSLTWLSVRGCSKIKPDSLSEVLRTHQLCHLDMANLADTGHQRVQLPLHYRQSRLHHLSMAEVYIAAPQLLVLVEQTTALTHLDLTSCTATVNNVTLQALSGIAVHLRSLLLGTTNSLTAAALMGQCSWDDRYTHLPDTCDECKLSQSSHRRLLSSSTFSRHTRDLMVERSIMMGDQRDNVAEWQRLTDSMVGARQTVEANDDSGRYDSLNIRQPASIVNLRGLRRLCLAGMIYLTDHALATVFCFRELVYLDLSNCAQISSIGLGAMAARCSSIEELLLASCDRVDDVAVLAVTQLLPRLAVIDLQDNSLLTSDALDTLSRCRQLRRLNITHCTGMTQSAVENICCMNTSVEVVIGAGNFKQDGTSRRDELFTKTPPPPPALPLLARMKNRIFPR